MRALRIEAEGLTTSFRYPHFLVGRQPSYRMPPPATIYGHVSSAVGDFLDPASLSFGYTFRAEGVGDDLELLHIATVKGGGRWPGGGNLPVNLEVTTNPAPREVLLNPRLVLYLASESDSVFDRLYQSFREPRYAVCLGRSQDLFAYWSVDVVDLEPRSEAYVEDTLLPWSFRPRVVDGFGVTMPRFVDPNNRTRVTWSPLVVLQGRVYTATVDRHVRSGELANEPNETWWVDPRSPTIRERQRGVIWHGFLPDESERFVFVGPSARHLGEER